METAKVNIRKNDIVKVIAGREKGKVGRFLKVDREMGRIFVEKLLYEILRQRTHSG